ncbi:alpha/beta fold hydrolase [Nonomuraea antimicrobica]
MTSAETHGETVLTEHFANVRGVRLAWFEARQTGVPVLALHGHFGRGRAFAALAESLAPRHRVIALEQRGHGHSGRGDGDFSPDAYVADAADFLRGLGLGPVVVLGHSMGGVTAFRLAARHPDLVRALIVEDGGAFNRRPDIPHPVLDVRGWPRRAPPWPRCAAPSRPRASPTPATSWRAPSSTPTAGGCCSTTTT